MISSWILLVFLCSLTASSVSDFSDEFNLEAVEHFPDKEAQREQQDYYRRRKRPSGGEESRKQDNKKQGNGKSRRSHDRHSSKTKKIVIGKDRYRGGYRYNKSTYNKKSGSKKGGYGYNKDNSKNVPTSTSVHCHCNCNNSPNDYNNNGYQKSESSLSHSAYQTHSAQNEVIKKAVVELVAAAGDSSVSGVLTLTTCTVWDPKLGQIKAVKIQGAVYGLDPGLHGFHIHQEGKLTDGCKDAGGHFNPHGYEHASPWTPERHAGALGNIATHADGLPTKVSIIDKMISLGSGADNDVANRAIVIHGGEDDLGLGGAASSKLTGNAGPRVACGKIVLLN